MRFTPMVRPATAVFAAAVLASCDLLPGARPVAEQPLTDTAAVFGDTAGAEPVARARPRRSSRRSGGGGAAVRSDSAAADSARDTMPAPPPQPTPAQRAHTTMSADLRRLADAQAEHIANEGRYSPRLSRLGLRYIPHAGVSVQIVSGDAAGWAAVATHESFPDDRCVIWVGQAASDLTSVAPAEGIPGCTGR